MSGHGSREGIRAVLSDLDGVLVDSTGSVERSWRRWAEQHGLDTALVVAAAHGRPSIETVLEVAPGLDAEAESAGLERAQAEDTNGVAALPGAAELLADPAGRSLAVVTSCTVPLARSRFLAAGLSAPPVVVTAERVRRGKPDPEAYLIAAETLGVRPEACLVVEDAPAGIAAGRAAGMTVAGLATTHERSELGGAHVVFRDPRGVLAWLASR